MVEQLFLAVPWGLQFVIVVFPDHTHLLFLNSTIYIHFLKFLHRSVFSYIASIHIAKLHISSEGISYGVIILIKVSLRNLW